MAEDQTDDSDKTEDPTQKRISEARQKGQVARSQEVNHWFIILAAALWLSIFAGPMARRLVQALRSFIEQPHAIRLDSFQLRDVLMDTAGQIGLALMAPLALVTLAALVAGLIQNGLVISSEPIIPKIEKISLTKGLKRMFSAKSVVEFVKGVAKVSIVATVVMILLWPKVGVIPNIAGLSLSQFTDLLQGLAVRVLIGVLSVMTLIAVLDFMFQKQQHLKQLRMSKQETKEEFKQTEGDPMVKGRLRQIRMERARKRMMAAVPEADVVITNPTHYAVALKYNMNSMDAPRLVAKGIDSLAMKIRELAEEHKIPIVENPPLTRALYQAVDLDQEIPAEHYKAVAEIIGYVMRLKGTISGDPGRSPS